MNADDMIKAVSVLVVVLLCIMPGDVSAVTIAPFSLPPGAGMTILNDFEQNRKGRRDKDNQSIQREEDVSLRQLIRVAEDKRLTNHDEWLLIYFIHRETTEGGSRGFQRYQPAGNAGLKVRFYRDGDTTVITALDGSVVDLTEDQREIVEQYADRTILFQQLVKMTTDSDWFVGEQRDLTGSDAISDFKATAASLTLTQDMTRWERNVAEFRLDLTLREGFDCEIFYWVLAELGRPVHLSMTCGFELQQDGIDFYHREFTSRSYAYTDLAISQLSPQPLVAQQPKGKVLDLAFSDSTGQLTFLTQDYESETNWLTFWDLEQRKAVHSRRQAGERILLSENEASIFTIAEQRMHEGWIKVDNKYKAFGRAVDMNLADNKQIVDAALLALYPITLNAGGELEVWNLGYDRVLATHPITVHHAARLAVNDVGQLITANTAGEFAVHKLSLTSRCEKPLSEAYCDVVDVDFTEADTTLNFDLEIKENKSLQSIVVHGEKPWVLYCTEFPAHCGFIDWQTGKQQRLGWSQNAMFDKNGKVVLDTGSFDPLTGKESRFEGVESYWPNMALSTERQLLFNKLPRVDHITDHEIKVRHGETGEVLDTIKRQVYPVRKLLAVDDTNLAYFTAPYFGSGFHNLDIATLTVEHGQLPMQVYQATQANGWLAIAANDYTSVSRLDNTVPARFFNHGSTDLSLVGGYLISARGNAVYRYDLMNDEEELLHRFDSRVHRVLVLDDSGDKLVVQLNRGVFALPHLDKELDLPFYGAMTNALALAADGQSFFVSGLTGYSAAYNPAIKMIQQFDLNGEPLQEMEPQWNDSSVMLATTNGQLWSGNKSGDLVIRDISSGLILETISAHQGSIVDMIQLNPETIVTASTDGAVKLWRLDLPNGKFAHQQLGVAYPVYVEPGIGKRQPRLKSTLIVDAEGGHIMSLADGYYWASPRALHNASFVNGDEIFDYARFDFWLNRPDRVLERLGRMDYTAQTQWQKMVAYRQQRNPERPRTLPETQVDFGFELTGPRELVHLQDIQLNYSADQSAKSLHLLVNQVPVFGATGKRINDRSGSLALSLTPGVNRIKAFVTNDQGMPSQTRYLTYHGNTEVQPNLYVLAIGVSNYALDRLDLNFAGKDATDMVQALKTSNQFGEVFNMQVLDTDATRDNILAARTFLEKARAVDSVIVFFAGHGLLDSKDDYFFGTTDIDPENPAAKGLAYAEMSGLLDGLSARQKLMLMDTCYSGEVTESPRNINLPDGVATRGLSFASESEVNVSHTMLQKTFVDLRASTGAIVISAAGGREFAIETDGAENGIFTASFIKGLKQADIDNNGQVTVSELRSFTYDEVSRLSAGAQKPTARKHNLDVDFAIF